MSKFLLKLSIFTDNCNYRKIKKCLNWSTFPSEEEAKFSDITRTLLKIYNRGFFGNLVNRVSGVDIF